MSEEQFKRYTSIVTATFFILGIGCGFGLGVLWQQGM